MWRSIVSVTFLALFMAGCGGGDSAPTPPATYTVGGTVTGVSGPGLVLHSNFGGDLAISASGPFTFSTRLPVGSTYTVDVKSAPTSPPAQACQVTNGIGTIVAANVMTVTVTCGAGYTVGGTVTGLRGPGLVLTSYLGGDLAISASGPFTFSMRFLRGSTYSVAIKSQPSSSAADTCKVANGSGTIAAANVTNVAVTCQYDQIGGGTVSGLVGSGLVLQLRAPAPYGSKGVTFAVTNPLPITADGPFTITRADLIDPSYLGLQPYFFLSIRQQPGSPTQSCMLQHAAKGNAYADVGCSQFAYVANAGDNTVSAYTVNPSSGALAAIGPPTATGASPYATVGFEYSGEGKRFLYVANEGGNDLSAFAVNVVTGALTAVPGSPFAAGTDPKAMASDGVLYLYVASAGSDNVSAYSIDEGTGALAPVSPGPATVATGKSPTSIAVVPDSFIYVANHGGSNDISAFNRDLTPVPGSPFPAGGNPLSLALGAGGKFLYAANPDTTTPTISGFSIDPTTGVLSPLSGSPFPLPVSHYLATDLTGTYLYVTSGATIVGYAIDATTGALTALPGFPVAAGANAYSVSIDPFNQFLYVANDSAANVSGFKLDASTGALTPMAGSPFPAGGLADFLAPLVVSPF